MAGTRYAPGTWLGIVRGHTAVLLGPDTPPALAGAVWDLLGTDPGVHEVLHAVTSSSGGSLAQMPSFGILDASGPLRVFLRGDLDLAVELPDGAVELDGRDVTTWNERRFALSGACRLTLPAAGPPGQPELPLGEGVVLLQSLALVLAPRQPERGFSAAPPAPVVLDSAGIADVRDAAPGAGGADEMTFAPDHEASAETVAPDHGASAETVVGVLDDDPQAEDDAYVGVAGSGAESAHDGASPAGSAPAHVPASDHTSSYDHLWERTVVRSIEDAAVREDAEADMAEANVAGTPEGPEVEEQAEPPMPRQPGAQELPTPAAAPRAAAPAAPPVSPGTPAFAVPRPAAGVLIDSVPWKKGEGTAIHGGKQPVEVPQDSDPQADVPYASAEPRPAPAPAGVPPSTAPGGAAPALAAQPFRPGGTAFDTDHDGQTVMRSNVAPSAGQLAAPLVEDPAAGPTVLARVCSQGHANPPTRAQCAACGTGLLPDAVQVPRPRLGRVRMSTGELLDLDQSLVIGRQPSVSRVQGGIMPRLVQVPSPEGDISRSHVEIRLEGWHVMLCDLKATNGTVLVREGQSPRRLAQNEMAILLDGDIAELGENISLRFEEIP